MPFLAKKILVYLSNRPHFLWVYRRDNPRGMLGEHEKIHSPSAPDLQAFQTNQNERTVSVIW